MDNLNIKCNLKVKNGKLRPASGQGLLTLENQDLLYLKVLSCHRGQT